MKYAFHDGRYQQVIDDEHDDIYDDQTKRYIALLPGWFVDRMTTDVWHFGLMTSHGAVICIDNISRVYQAADGAVWIDVTLSDLDASWFNLDNAFVAPTARTSASINTRHIVAAFEIADS